MTTPERIRRRQRVLESLAVVAIVLSLASVAWSNHQNAKQRACITDYAKHNSEVQQLRAELGDRNAKSVDTFLLGVTDLVAHPDQANGQEKFAALSEKFAKEQAQLAKDRADHPVPDFPDGCAS